MQDIYIKEIASRIGARNWQVENCIELIEEGATVPFISRYRKEKTGALDEVQVAEIKHLHGKFSDLDERKAFILKSVSEHEGMTPEKLAEITEKVSSLLDPQELEDIYLPYRPRRRTRASAARECGLEPLADEILTFRYSRDLAPVASRFLNEKVVDMESALSGARDIIAERISEMQEVRAALRSSYGRFGMLHSKVVKSRIEEADKYSNYFDYREPVGRIASHRLLAVLRGDSEGLLSVKIDIDAEKSEESIIRVFNSGKRLPQGACGDQVRLAVDDAYRRLLHPSIENEVIRAAKEKADIESIRVFGENLRQLLLAPPVGQKRTLAIDPGFRTGCKVVCLDAQGALLHNDTIYPHPPQNEKVNAMKKISNLVESYRIEVIAIGNGTASRETEAFIRKIALPEGVKVYSVSEDGASVYSASPVAREEFPDYDVTVRGAVSIGRRLMDPLAELVKIDPKSLGIGQYQHDVDQAMLKEKLDEVVELAVNSVGVNLNTASKHLLSYVSGIGPALAQNIVDYRTENGAFSSRQQLLSVKRLGAKAFEQSAGFLRVPGGENPLDNSAVHPESYELVKRIAADLNMKLADLISNQEALSGIDPAKYASEGEYTVKDIINELAKPGRDPRSTIKVFEFSSEIHALEDVKCGMKLPGIVTNITNFGAFVDVGIKENGLIHVSNMASGRHVSDLSKYVRLHQHIMVEVLNVDVQRKRLQLRLVSD